MDEDPGKIARATIAAARAAAAQKSAAKTQSPSVPWRSAARWRSPALSHRGPAKKRESPAVLFALLRGKGNHGEYHIQKFEVGARYLGEAASKWRSLRRVRRQRRFRARQPAAVAVAAAMAAVIRPKHAEGRRIHENLLFIEKRVLGYFGYF